MNKWDYYCIRKIGEIYTRRVRHRIPENYAGRKMIDAQTANDCIAQQVIKGEPFMAGRFGSIELGAILRREAHKNHRLYKNTDYNLCNNAGFFPQDEKLIDKFAREMTKIVGEIDLLGVWYSSLEEYMVAEYMPTTRLTQLVALEPYYYANPWSKQLKGKKVLVVHPFEESIISQYGRREKIHGNPDVLPEFELQTIKAVQTIAGQKDDRFESWFDALEYMKNEIHKRDFDVAIIGCGAYGMPLAIEAKRMGKQAIHMGGATQILFGIKGARWDKNPNVSSLYNEYWVRPSEKERVQNSATVENSCYW